MSTRRWLLLIAAALLATAGFFAVLFVSWGGGADVDLARAPFGGRGRRVGLVRVVGPIVDSEEVVEEIELIGERSGVEGLVVRLDSGGGGVAASQEIYEAVRRVSDKGVPVVASLGSVAASGAYYVACAADTIVANPGTVTGSIGVILSFPVYYELIRKVGLDWEVVKTGEHKDMGSPTREVTDSDRILLQSLLDDAHEQFVEAVAEGRGLSPSAVRTLADGRVFTGRQAKDLGLVDVLGDQKRAIRVAADMAGIEGEPVLVTRRERRPWLLEALAGAARGLLREPSANFRLEYRALR